MRSAGRVSVVGGSDADEQTVETAEAVGAGLADLGAVLVTGGLGGTMEATARGYKDAGGPLSIGLLPGPDRAAANPHVDLAVATDLGHARNALVVLNGDVVLALPGSGGTMSEVGLALAVGRPVVAVGAWEELAGVEAAGSVEDALERVAALLKSA